MDNSLIIAKNTESYYITNVNYVEIDKEDYFNIINDNKFLFKRVNGVEILNGVKMRVLNILSPSTDNINEVDWLEQYQINTLNAFMETNPETMEEDYYLLNLAVLGDDVKEVVKRLSFSSKIEDSNVVSNIYSNILNIQTNDYFEHINRVILLTNNLFIDDGDLVEYVSENILFNINFRTITKRVASLQEQKKPYVLKKSPSIFVLLLEKLNRDGTPFKEK